jgi:UrcA family protein
METCKTLRRLCLTGAALAALAGTAYADDYAMHKVTIHYGDLNLNTQAGAETLYHRIGGAARFVCGDEGRSLTEEHQWQTCYHDSVDHAVDTVHSPLLTSLNKGHGSHARATASLITMVR